jgi:hypothetical protein
MIRKSMPSGLPGPDPAWERLGDKIMRSSIIESSRKGALAWFISRSIERIRG